MALELRPLNVLIGPNGSGKSNLLEVISLLKAAPKHLAAPVRDGGGIRDWIWQGQPGSEALLEVVVENLPGRDPVRHTIEFTEQVQKFQLVGERIEDARRFPHASGFPFFYIFEHGQAVLCIGGRGQRTLTPQEIALDESIISQRKDPDQYPELTHLGEVYAAIGMYREWTFGRYTLARQPQKADQRNDVLEPDGRNLGLVLNRLRRDARVKHDILENLRQLYDGIEDYDVSVEGGTVQVFLHESGFTIPATRLSDGTLRYLCLLAVLCDPFPPPLVCIEEPELGLHPDLMPTLARLLKSAAARTQIITTTHSDILVDGFTDQPESVIVCEKTDGQTSMKRLEADRLTEWLERYRLGELWTKGELGGVRW
jgi:predicted ATPase